ncbi:hypothetical protein [Streptomyces capitiformicae]|nr:hypothetical protein [Streptomyces capitiformicae]
MSSSASAEKTTPVQMQRRLSVSRVPVTAAEPIAPWLTVMVQPCAPAMNAEDLPEGLSVLGR